MNNLLIKIILTFSFLLSFANAEILKKFEISGNKRISDETVIIFSELKVNEEVSKSKLDLVIKNLYKTNFFNNVKVEFSNHILKIFVEENPIIENIVFNGVKAKNKRLKLFL